MFFKSCDFDFQIFIQSKKEDISEILKNLEIHKKLKENKSIEKLYEKYIEYIKELNINKKSSSKSFFIIIKESEDNINYKNIKLSINEKYKKIKDSLMRCGNIIYDINNSKDVLDIIDQIYNPKKFIF